MAKKNNKSANDNVLQAGHAGLHAVGYGKPPKHRQFKAGQSGNPKGRPKGSKNLISVYNEIFDQQLTVLKNGKPKRVPMMQGLLLKLAAMATAGDLKAISKMLDLYNVACSATNDNQPQTAGSSFELTPEEFETIKKSNLLKGIK